MFFSVIVLLFLFTFLNLTTRKRGGLLFIVFISLFLRLALHICSISWVLFVCVCLCVSFGNILNFLKKEKYLENCCDLQSERKKQSKLAARIKVFVFFLHFALTQRNRDCVGFFTLSYRKMLTFTVRLLLVCLSCMCVCVFLVCNYFKRENFFSTSFKVMMLQASKPKSCFVYVF